MSNISSNFTGARQALWKDIQETRNHGGALPIRQNGDQILLTGDMPHTDPFGNQAIFKAGTTLSNRPLSEHGKNANAEEKLVYQDPKGGTHILQRTTKANHFKVEDRVDDTYIQPDGTNRGTCTEFTSTFGANPVSTLNEFANQEWRIAR